ncbi:MULTISPECIES: ABC transporter permease [unclassified Pseudovibrio]|uniref:ABC transporter permease n=1 Tax=unclassified Pseudovibrio TaxID=2627060 RepID=UPI0007AED3BE|nr:MULTISPECIES: ABC transporter permease [unclassified Pseudovibrio]KZK92080.1 Glutathione transport system permease protein GsiC [Pseudovibrio sp. Ad5]KZK94995.1 Glutathione transport system permease protein GsiC [Pseudovibrio sp. W74]KZL08798.1 Glutathione transport system permease protein GsiC [Pseudovibrio sp. Ad14]
MLWFAFLRLIGLLTTLLAASLVIFVVLEVIPGDPAEVMLGLNAQPDTLAALRAELGLNAPLSTRYVNWLLGMLRGEFGVSYTYSVPVSELIGERIQVSLPLATGALILSTVIAIPIGVYSARYHGKVIDTGIMSIAQIGIAIPNFWIAILLVYVFAIVLRVLPSGGFPGWDVSFFGSLQALLLPVIALALPQASILARVMRSALLDVLHEDYIRTARAKGLSNKATLWRHGVRNALIPVLTILGLQFSFLIAGTVIIENLFYLPGLGRLIFQGITQRDLIVVKSSVMLLVALTIFVTFLVDIAYAAIDPRLRRRA